MRARGSHISPTARIQHGCHLGPNIDVGERVSINTGCLIETQGGVSIGDDVAIGMRVTIISTTHAIGPMSRRAGRHRQARVAIESGSWIGAGAYILPGVTIGAGGVIAAGAVVEKSTEPNGIYAGVPARLLRRLDHTNASQSAAAIVPLAM